MPVLCPAHHRPSGGQVRRLLARACPPGMPTNLLGPTPERTTERLSHTNPNSASKSVTIDRTKHLGEQPHTGHNRWHPDLTPVFEADEGEQVALETRDALAGYLNANSTVADFATVPLGSVHPLTGPVYVKGAVPGDLLEVEFVDIVSEPWAFSAIMPGLGFLRDVMTDPFLVHWQIEDGWATSAQLPGVRLPGGPFMGVSGVAPSRQQVAAWAKREAEVATRGEWRWRPTQTERCLLSARPQPTACEPCRHGKTVATLTSNSSPGARSCSCRSTSKARCSRPAMRTSPRATARCV
jgi:hypothetical protein